MHPAPRTRAFGVPAAHADHDLFEGVAMLGMDVVKQRLAEILRDVETDATLKTLRYIEDVKSWEVEVEVKSGGVRVGRIPEEWLEEDDEEKLHNRLSGLLLKERPEKR